MIAKTADSNRPTDPRNEAGLAAERKMAFYLRRAFETERDIWVFNDLRLTRNGDAAQIDHLVLHPSGMVIVESKSVSGEIAVNERQEWIRRSGKHEMGMESPVAQGKLQAEFLRRLLRENDDRLLDGQVKGLLPKHFNRHWPIDILVAISDSGRINRCAEVPELVKADQAAQIIQEIVSKHRRGRWSPNPLSSYGDFALTRQEIGRVVAFLESSHTPLVRASNSHDANTLKSAGLTTANRSPADTAGELFERLRELRRRLAASNEIPAYMVFSDATLRSIAAERPRTKQDLLRVSGVGQKKLGLYGQDFLDLVNQGR
jgi:hypothetical protein